MVECTKWIERITNQFAWYKIIGKIACTQVSTYEIEKSEKLNHVVFIVNRELLIECGIGLSKDAVVSTHRALVFCQMKVMIDVIINQVLG